MVRRLGPWFGLVSILVVSAAEAAPSSAERESARRLMDEGRERTKRGDYQRALDAFKKANDLMKVPSTGFAVARAYVALGQLVEARDAALEVLRLPRESNEPKPFVEARKNAKELETSLKARIPTVKIVVKGGPATKVTVDDGEVAAILLGEPVAMNPGKHVITAKNADGVAAKADVDLAEKDAKSVEIDLPAATPQVIETPVAATPKPSPAWEQPSERTPVANVLVYGGFGLAIVGLGVGGVTGFLAKDKADSVKPQCENGICDPAAKSDLDGATTMAAISNIGFAAAGVGLVCGVIGLALPKSRKAHSELQLPKGTATLHPALGGVVLSGSF